MEGHSCQLSNSSFPSPVSNKKSYLPPPSFQPNNTDNPLHLPLPPLQRHPFDQSKPNVFRWDQISLGILWS